MARRHSGEDKKFHFGVMPDTLRIRTECKDEAAGQQLGDVARARQMHFEAVREAPHRLLVQDGQLILLGGSVSNLALTGENGRRMMRLSSP